MYPLYLKHVYTESSFPMESSISPSPRFNSSQLIIIIQLVQSVSGGQVKGVSSTQDSAPSSKRKLHTGFGAAERERNEWKYL